MGRSSPGGNGVFSSLPLEKVRNKNVMDVSNNGVCIESTGKGSDRRHNSNYSELPRFLP